MDVCELLGLDHQTVTARVDAYRGYAAAMGKNGHKPTDHLLAVHCMAAAACYGAVVNQEIAREDFRGAADMAMTEAARFRERGSHLRSRAREWQFQAVMLAGCGSDFSLLDQISSEEFHNENFPAATYLSLLLTVLKASTAHRDRRHSEKMFRLLADRAAPVQSIPAGALQIPLSFAIRLGRLVYSGSDNGLEQQWWSWGFSFGRRLQERLSLAQLDRFHWVHLYSRLLPIEPDGLLAVGSWQQMTQTHRLNVHSQDKRFRELPPAMRAYLEAARQIFRDAAPDEGRRAA